MRGRRRGIEARCAMDGWTWLALQACRGCHVVEKCSVPRPSYSDAMPDGVHLYSDGYYQRNDNDMLSLTSQKLSADGSATVNEQE